jgi:hypothetical protein
MLQQLVRGGNGVRELRIGLGENTTPEASKALGRRLRQEHLQMLEQAVEITDPAANLRQQDGSRSVIASDHDAISPA